jgi:hypothetical protein
MKRPGRRPKAPPDAEKPGTGVLAITDLRVKTDPFLKDFCVAGSEK